MLRGPRFKPAAFPEAFERSMSAAQVIVNTDEPGSSVRLAA